MGNSFDNEFDIVDATGISTSSDMSSPSVSLSPSPSSDGPRLSDHGLTLNSFIPILKRLSSLYLEKNSYYICGSIATDDWRDYAKKVTRFFLTDAIKDSEARISLTALLRLARHQLPLLPSLSDLVIVDADASIDYLELLITPSLKSLEASCIPNARQSTFYSFLTAIEQEAPLLQTLILGPGRFPSRSLQIISKFKNIRHLELKNEDSEIPFVYFDNIGSLPKLETFILDARYISTMTKYQPNNMEEATLPPAFEDVNPLSSDSSNPMESKDAAGDVPLSQTPISTSGTFTQLAKLHVIGWLPLLEDLIPRITSTTLEDVSITLIRLSHQELQVSLAKEKVEQEKRAEERWRKDFTERREVAKKRVKEAEIRRRVDAEAKKRDEEEAIRRVEAEAMKKAEDEAKIRQRNYSEAKERTEKNKEIRLREEGEARKKAEDAEIRWREEVESKRTHQAGIPWEKKEGKRKAEEEVWIEDAEAKKRSKEEAWRKAEENMRKAEAEMLWREAEEKRRKEEEEMLRREAEEEAQIQWREEKRAEEERAEEEVAWEAERRSRKEHKKSSKKKTHERLASLSFNVRTVSFTELLRTLYYRTTSLETVSVCQLGASFQDLVNPPTLPEEMFRELVLLPAIESLEVKGWTLDSVESVINASESIPKLKSLLLPLDETNSGISLHTLRHIAKICPKLESFQCRIEPLSLIPEYDIPTIEALSHGLQILSVGNSFPLPNTKKLYPIARHLYLLFPNLKTINTFPKYNADQWVFVDELVKMCQTACIDDTNRLSAPITQ